MAITRTKLPLMPEAKVRNGYDFDVPSIMGYDEVIFDYRTNRYLTLSQQKEIDELKTQLVEKEKRREENLKSIIGYFYKRN